MNTETSDNNSSSKKKIAIIALLATALCCATGAFFVLYFNRKGKKHTEIFYYDHKRDTHTHKPQEDKLSRQPLRSLTQNTNASNTQVNNLQTAVRDNNKDDTTNKDNTTNDEHIEQCGTNTNKNRCQEFYNSIREDICYIRAQIKNPRQTIQAVTVLMVKQRKHYAQYLMRSDSLLCKCNIDEIRQVLLNVYNMDRTLRIHSRLFDKDVKTYKETSMMLYKYILYDRDTYQRYIRNITAQAISTFSMFSYEHSVYKMSVMFVQDILQNSLYEVNKILEFAKSLCTDVCEAAEQTDRLMQTELVPLRHIYDHTRDTYTLKTHNKDNADLLVNEVILQMYSVTIADIVTDEKHETRAICFNIGKTTFASSVIHVYCNPLLYKEPYIQRQYTLRECLYTYTLNHFVEDSHNKHTFINVGHIMAMAITPHIAHKLPFDNCENRVTEIQDSNVILKNTGIVYIGGSLHSLSTFSSFSHSAQTLHRHNIPQHMAHRFKGYSGTTVSTQSFDSRHAERHALCTRYPLFFMYSSCVKLDDLTTQVNNDYNEMNVPQYIPLGSTVIKTCVEIIESYFHLLMNSELLKHKAQTSHQREFTDEIYTKMHMFIDVPEQNIYNTSKYDIRQMYAKTMSYMLTVLNEKKEDMLNILTTHNTQFTKEHYYEAYTYLQKLQIIVVHTDTSSITEREHYMRYYNRLYQRYDKLARAQYSLMKHIQLSSTKITLKDKHMLDRIASMSILRPRQSITHIESLEYTDSIVSKLIFRIQDIIIKYMKQAPCVLLYEKYELQQTEYGGKVHDAIDKGFDKSLPICIITSEQHDYDFNELLQQIKNVLKEYKIDIQDKHIDKAYKKLQKNIEQAAMRRDARLIMDSLGMYHNTSFNVTLAQEDKELCAMLQCNIEIAEL